MWQCINRCFCSHACRIQIIYLVEAHTCILCWLVSGTFGIFLERKWKLAFLSPKVNKGNHCMYSNARPRSSKTWSAGLLHQQSTAGNMPENSERLQDRELFWPAPIKRFFPLDLKYLWRSAGNPKGPDSGSWTIIPSICDCPYHRDNPLYPHRGKQRYAKKVQLQQMSKKKMRVG